MCGIAGIVFWKNSNLVLENEISKMLACLKHRGPDNVGFKIFQNQNCSTAIGNTRLSIVDIKNGDQPILNKNKDVAIVQNGEIYNYKILKLKLIEKGHVFKTESDTEVILNLYLEYGQNFVSYLEGFFAVCIYDGRENKIIIAKDSVGKKPLFYFYGENIFSFASEIQAISKVVKTREIDYSALNSYLSYLTIPQDECIFKKINKVLPGNMVVINLENKEINTIEYLQFNSQNFNENKYNNINTALEDFEHIFENAIRKRLIGDEEIGCFLSGGIDSSAITLKLAEFSPKKLKTFSAGFENKEFNELPFAKKISDIAGTDHNQLVVKPDVENIIGKLCTNLGEPFGDSSIIATYYIAKMAREKVKVVLSGDGGDELFGGYNHQLAWKISSYLDKIFFMKKINSYIPNTKTIFRKNNVLHKALRMIGSLKYNNKERYLNYHTIFSDYEKSKIFKENYMKYSINNSKIDKLFIDYNANIDPIDFILEIDRKWLMPNDFLVKMDIASMSNSLEVRSPFLDNDVISFARSLPSKWKINFLDKKFFLKKYLSKKIPKNLIYRKKQGFNLPIRDWIKNDLKKTFQEKIFEGKFIKEHFNLEFTRALFNDHINNKNDNSHKLWSLYVLQIWSEIFLND